MGNKRLPFRVEMARAWHEGRKTVTRRLMNQRFVEMWEQLYNPCFIDGVCYNYAAEEEAFRAPYAPGSTVIIAEPLVARVTANNNVITCYASDESPVLRTGFEFGKVAWQWKVKSLSGRCMPNWAARSWARVLSVRVERLQEITEEDCWAEGIERSKESPTQASTIFSDYASPRRAYSLLIDSINGPGTWDANPWVFRYELEKLTEAPHE
jgi:hypothetical protein